MNVLWRGANWLTHTSPQPMGEEMSLKQNPSWDYDILLMKLIFHLANKIHLPEKPFDNLLLWLCLTLANSEMQSLTQQVFLFEKKLNIPKGWEYGYLHLQNGIVSLRLKSWLYKIWICHNGPPQPPSNPSSISEIFSCFSTCSGLIMPRVSENFFSFLLAKYWLCCI